MIIYFSLTRGIGFINFTLEIQLSPYYLNVLTRDLFITLIVVFPHIELNYYFTNRDQYDLIVNQAGDTLAQDLI